MTLEQLRKIAEIKVTSRLSNYSSLISEIISAFKSLSPIEQSEFEGIKVEFLENCIFFADNVRIPFEIKISTSENYGFYLELHNARCENISITNGFGIVDLKNTTLNTIRSHHKTALQFNLYDNSTARLSISYATILSCKIINSTATLDLRNCILSESVLKEIVENNNINSKIKAKIINPSELSPILNLNVGLAIRQLQLKNFNLKHLSLREFTPHPYKEKTKISLDEVTAEDELSLENFSNLSELIITDVSTELFSIQKTKIVGRRTLISFTKCLSVYIDDFFSDHTTFRLSEQLFDAIFDNIHTKFFRISSTKDKHSTSSLTISNSTINNIYFHSGSYEDISINKVAFSNISFTKSTVESDLVISSESQLVKNVRSSKCNFEGSLHLATANITSLHLSDTSITGVAWFNSITFHKVPTFRACTFKSTLDLSKSTFNDPGEDDIHDLRTIKKIMNEHGNDHEEQRFSSLELDCHHKTTKERVIDETIDIITLRSAVTTKYLNDISDLTAFAIYQLLNSKGRSPFKPLYIFFFQIFIFQYIYYFLFSAAKPDISARPMSKAMKEVFGDGANALLYSLHNSSGPFNLLKLSSWGFTGEGIYILLAKFIGYIQIVLCTILIYLIVVGLKRKLRTT